MPVGKKVCIGLLAGYAGLFGILFLNGYLLGDATFWIGIDLIPLIIWNASGKKSLWLLPLIVLLLVVCLIRTELTFRYFLLVTCVLFAVQSLTGKVDMLLCAVLLIISPLFRYVSEVFTFPIRLKLSDWSGALLQAANIPARVSGNIIQVNGSDFSVDSACMGLQMTGFSLLAAIFLIIHTQRKSGKELAMHCKILILSAAFGLNIFSNLMRIITLVIFKIGPENPLHDLAGVICLLLYVWLPVSFLVQYFDKHFSKPITRHLEIQWKSAPGLIAVHFILLAFCGYFVAQKRTLNIAISKSATMGTAVYYQMNVLESGVTQFKNRQALVYVKPIQGFYSTEHNPALCWVGSGYELNSVKEQWIGGKMVYTGTLTKGRDKLQTAWWFSNKRHITISQLDWRWRAMRGEGDFQLVNVTSSNSKDLNLSVYQWLQLI